MGPSTASMVEYLPKPLVSKIGRRDRYPIWIAKSILRQDLLGIDFLHQSGISHGDLQPGNLLFSVAALYLWTRFVYRNKKSILLSLQPIERQDRKVDLWAPKYLAVNQLLTEFVDLNPNFVIKISDMGGVPTRSQDIWSFCCLVFEFIIGRPLFVVDTTGNKDETNDDHFLQLFSLLDTSPQSYIGELPEGFDLNDLQPLLPLEVLFDQEKPVDMRDEDSKQIKHILRWILQQDDTKRPSASQLLSDPWFLELSTKKSQA
ncbi:kinase-like domain-containing protein [Amylocarpus encephaloides]|uniref:Kinase-like domain-containing protein n=1 Tax=Amylocarpus encephaloides TaxID=45428 RepID=A0A9P8C598_9HELO|nr:kinase-like domain-containing protein [Amylocarpus encephaloides]